MRYSDKNQRGVSLIAALFIIVILAFMGTMLVSLMSTSSLTSVSDLRSAQALYLPDGGLESAVLSLTTPTLSQRQACSSLTGTVTTLGSGQFSVTADAGSPYYPTAAATLSGSISSSTATITVDSTTGYAPSGRILIDRESIDYSGISGNSFIGAVRGRDDTSAASHASSARVGQNQCSITSTGGVPNLTSPIAKRVVSAGVQLQEGWIAATGNVTNYNLRGIDCAATNDCWAVGDGGTTLHYDGASWSNVSTGITQNLRSVSAAAGNAVWAVGDGGTILRWNGANWSAQTSPTAENLRSVKMVTALIGYAVGTNGAIIRTANGGTTWSIQGSGVTTFNLNSVSCFDGNRCLAVGDNTGTQPTMLATTNGATWGNYTASDAPATSQNLNGLMIYNASSLLGLGLGGCTNYGVGVGNGGSAIAAGGGLNVLGLLTLGGSGWTSIGSGQAQNLNGVVFFQRCCGLLCLGCCQDGWAVGNGGVIRRWNSGWNAIASPTTQNLNAVWVNTTNQNDGWAVGDAGTIIQWTGAWQSPVQQPSASMFRWDGTTWSDAANLLPINVQGLNSVSMLSYADGWAVGEAASTTADNGWTFLRWNNPTANSWNQPTVTTAARAANLKSVFMVSSQDGFAVGNTNSDSGGNCTGSRARILRWNGTSWSCQTSPALAQLNSVSMLDTANDGTADDGWAVGTRSAATTSGWNLVRWNGTTWSLTNAISSSTTAQNMYSVSMISASDGWAVGVAAGTGNTDWRLLRWNNPNANQWTLTNSVSPATAATTLYSVYMLSATDGWAVGASGIILRWNSPTASSWNVVSSPTTNQLNSVRCTQANDCWAEGVSGTTLHWDGSSWSSISTGLPANTLNQVHIIGPSQRPASLWQEVVN